GKVFPNHPGIWGTSSRGPGVAGTSFESFGVYGQRGDPGGTAPPAGACGSSHQSFCVVGVSSQPGALFGRANKFAGVLRSAAQSVGVGGRSDRSYGLFGLSFAPVAPGTNPADVPAGVYGQLMTGGVGVLGVAQGAGASILGVNTGDAYAGWFEGNL